MSTFSKVILVGNVGSDPELRSTNGGDSVATLSLATSEKWTDKAGAKHENTDWHRIILWRELAKLVEKFVHKGDKILVEGKLRYRQWTDKDGQTRYSTEIHASNLTFLSTKKAAEESAAAASGAAESAGAGGKDDDLPF